MRLTIKHNGKSKSWVARTRRGFNKKQRKEILEFRRRCSLLTKESK